MGSKDAEDRFFEAVRNFRIADDKARNGGPSSIDAQAFKMAEIDLDAAIPGLSGVMLGRALLLKADCLYRQYLAGLDKVSIFEVIASVDPLLKEGHTCALKGRKILEELGSTVDLPWANDIVSRLGDYCSAGNL